MTQAQTITSKAKSNLAFALIDLPEEERRHMAEFYAFCRTVDDIVDEPGMTPRERHDALNRWMLHRVNNGVYKTGFAGTQDAYDAAYARLWTAMDWLEERLTDRRYLMGDSITEADVRLFTTLVRFDPVYHGHFKCNRSKITEIPVLWGYLRDLFQTPGFGDTVDFVQIKQHYYIVHRDLNPHGIVPKGPDLSGWLTPHGRDSLGGRPFGDGTPPGPVRAGEEVPNPLL